MTRLDWVIVGFAAFTAVQGLRRGLIRMIPAPVGLTAVTFIGRPASPHFPAGGSNSPYTAPVVLGGAVAGAALYQTAAVSASGLARSTARLAPPLRLFDSVGGLAAGAVWG